MTTKQLKVFSILLTQLSELVEDNDLVNCEILHYHHNKQLALFQTKYGLAYYITILEDGNLYLQYNAREGREPDYTYEELISDVDIVNNLVYLFANMGIDNREENE